MKLVVGIGNPGRRYEDTRHNLGMNVVDHFAEDCGIALRRRRFDALVGEGSIGSQRILLVKPQTYVNLTGSAVAPLLRWYRSSADDLLVVCDDMNLDLGKLRLRRKGASGGHNGLKSIVECLGTESFARLRIGVGRGDRADPVGHVLGRFDADERPFIEATVARAADATRRWIEQGVEAAMNAFNS